MTDQTTQLSDESIQAAIEEEQTLLTQATLEQQVQFLRQQVAFFQEQANHLLNRVITLNAEARQRATVTTEVVVDDDEADEADVPNLD